MAENSEITKKRSESLRKALLPVLPIRNAVLYPDLLMPLSVGREASVAAANAALAGEEKTLLIVAQKDGQREDPGPDDLFGVGTRAVIRRMSRSEGTLELLVQGVERVKVVRYDTSAPYLQAEIEALPAPAGEGVEVEALFQSVLELGQRALHIVQPEQPRSLESIVGSERDPAGLAYLTSSMLNLGAEKAQRVLEAASNLEALELAHAFLAHEVQVLELRQKIASHAATEMSKEQREYMLRQQLRAIQEELGESKPEAADLELLRKRIEEADLPEAVRKEAERELDRLARLPAAAPDYQITRGYVELVAELPWRHGTRDALDLTAARAVLDEDHYDLDDVKQRILEHLAVMKLNPGAHAPILCLVGPPGVGKTSLGQSIARALGRKFERMSLGGLHDEAELRGHRRTYIGAMPGRILQAIRRAGVNNPLLMLDEVDKLGRDFRGDPASALLEILDPAQNGSFHDNYLDLPFDLSKVFFIATANTLDSIPAPLLDRMEVLRLSGYSPEEKVAIAQRYIVPRRLAEAGLKTEQATIPDEALKRIVNRYTREAGVRELERAVGTIARKLARRFAEGKAEPVEVSAAQVPEYLGAERYSRERARGVLPPGVATGLAWTEFGGEVLYVEATRLPGRPRLRLTGSLGKVMRESAKAAQSYLWSHADELGLPLEKFRRDGVHIHVPSGAVPKDGPSAGVAMASVLASLYANRPVAKDVAMTGEITLAGLVLPVGGIREKVLAAHRAGLRRVILPRENAKDLKNLPEQVRAEMTFVEVDTVHDVLREALPGVAQQAREPAAAD
ncbi:MAG: endopeptidase La [Planctomycetota bacterium]|nr:endopeptidase La [Planctomycetota bacterium]